MLRTVRSSQAASAGEVVPYDQVLASVQAIYDDFAGSKDEVRALDAGCGTRNYVRFDRRVHLTGIDISPTQLDKNPNLDERVVGDVQTYDLPTQAFDVVVCWDVLEHLDKPRAAIERIANAVRPDGLLVVGSPNPRSLKGLVTRLTPFRFHVWVYRKFFGSNAGSEEGGGPFPTVMLNEGGPHSVMEVCHARGFSRALLVYWESTMQITLRKRLHLRGPLWAVARFLTRLLSIGSVDLVRTEYVCVMRRDKLQG